MFFLLLYYFQDTKCAVKIQELSENFKYRNTVKRGPEIRNFTK